MENLSTELLQTWLGLPEVQSVAAPFVAALLVALLLRPLGWTWSGLGLSAGFLLSAYLLGLLGPHLLQPGELNTADKILWLSIAALLVGLVYDIYSGSRQQSFPLLFALAGAAAVWLLWPLLGRQPLTETWPLTLAAVVYLGWLAAWSDGLRDEPLRAAGAGWVLALSTAVLATLGASALIAQLAIALGVAAGAVWLLALLMPKLRGGSLLALPALFVAGLLSLAAAVFANVPLYCLLPLALIPPLARLPLPSGAPRLGQAALLVALLLIPAAVAVTPPWVQSTASDAYGY